MVEATLPTPHSDEVECMAAQARAWTLHDTSFEKLGRYEARLSRQLLAYSKELDRLQQSRRAAADAAALADEEARYHRRRRESQERAAARQPHASEPFSAELASFCESRPHLKAVFEEAAFEMADPAVFRRSAAPASAEIAPEQAA
jgi:hypothetical protein